MTNRLIAASLLLVVCSISIQADTVYFLVSDFNPADRTDGYVLPLTDPNDIAHARDLIANGPGVGRPLVVAHIACGADNINRNFYSPTLNAWNWHITSFSGFADMTIEILDGNPNFVNRDCLTAGTTMSAIGFWSYTVVAELGQNPKPWMADLNLDALVNMNDWFVLSSYYWYGGCTAPLWCSYTDLNHDGVVNDADVMLLAYAWLSPFTDRPTWYSAWANPRQCHGDTDGQGTGIGAMKIWVNTTDLSFISTLYGRLPVSCTSLYYSPAADFDRDCDIDQTDVDIITYWGMKTGVPANCPTSAY
jgi:hypothetical protein